MANRLMELGDGVELWKVGVEELQEQDVNARVMDISAFTRLTENIKERGTLVESLPYCHQDPKGKISIISGHHRVRAARAANIHELHVLVDTKPMSRSKVVSKQLAHNAIAGHDDPEMLRQLIAEIDNVDDLLRSYVAPELLPPMTDPISVTATASLDFDFRLMMFTFLPSQMNDFEMLLDLIHSRNDFIGTASMEQYDAFHNALMRYQKARDVRAVGAAIAYLTDVALREAQLYHDIDPEEEDVWASIASVIESPSIPIEAAKTIRKAIDTMERQGIVGETNRWQALEFMAAEYLSANVIAP